MQLKYLKQQIYITRKFPSYCILYESLPQKRQVNFETVAFKKNFETVALCYMYIQ